MKTVGRLQLSGWNIDSATSRDPWKTDEILLETREQQVSHLQVQPSRCFDNFVSKAVSPFRRETAFSILLVQAFLDSNFWRNEFLSRIDLNNQEINDYFAYNGLYNGAFLFKVSGLFRSNICETEEKECKDILYFSKNGWIYNIKHAKKFNSPNIILSFRGHKSRIVRIARLANFLIALILRKQWYYCVISELNRCFSGFKLLFLCTTKEFPPFSRLISSKRFLPLLIYRKTKREEWKYRAECAIIKMMIGRWPSGGGTVANVEKVSVKRAEPYDGHVLAAISFISGRRDAGTYRGDRERNLCSKWPDMHARHG